MRATFFQRRTPLLHPSSARQHLHRMTMVMIHERLIPTPHLSKLDSQTYLLYTKLSIILTSVSTEALSKPTFQLVFLDANTPCFTRTSNESRCCWNSMKSLTVSSSMMTGVSSEDIDLGFLLLNRSFLLWTGKQGSECDFSSFTVAERESADLLLHGFPNSYEPKK